MWLTAEGSERGSGSRRVNAKNRVVVHQTSVAADDDDAVLRG